MRFDQRLVDLDPWKIREFRGGEGSPLVLLHGLSGSFGWWSRNRDAFAEHHLVAGIDLVGFGAGRRLTRAPLPLGFEDSVTLLRRWIDTRIGEPVHLIGHSMGGQLAIHLAATHPHLIRSLVLVSASGLRVGLQPGPHLKAMFRPPGSLLSFLPVLAWDALRAGPTAIGLALARLLRDDVTPLLGALSMPVLLVWGENDSLIPLRYAEMFDSAIPRARLEILPAAGHVPMWDRPREFNEVVLRYLDSVDEGREIAHEQSHQFSWGVQGCDEGICHRANGDRGDVILIHGLGIGSGYFRRLARSLDERGIHTTAPDLPGFGHSSSTDVATVDELVDRIARWADGHDLCNRVWAGHSTGALLIERLMRIRPDLIRGAVFISPIWNSETLSRLWLFEGIVRDAPKEPPQLVLHAIRAYWESGLLRVLGSFRWYAGDAKAVAALPAGSTIVHGERDPMIDRDHLALLGAEIKVIPGAHGIVFSHPEELAKIIASAEGLR